VLVHDSHRHTCTIEAEQLQQPYAKSTKLQQQHHIGLRPATIPALLMTTTSHCPLF
jgi:hypothetical protein